MIPLILCLLSYPVVDRPDDFSLVEIAGHCMEPLLMNGSYALIDRAVKFTDARVGDVIKFRYRKKQYAHRVIEIRQAGNGERFFICKGDNVATRETVTARDYMGRVCV
jgi:signal peptidase I